MSFAHLQTNDPEKLKAIATAGGKALHASGKRHKFTADEARAAALKSVEKRRKRLNAITRPAKDSQWLSDRERRIQELQIKYAEAP